MSKPTTRPARVDLEVTAALFDAYRQLNARHRDGLGRGRRTPVFERCNHFKEH